ncbi:hypothetical protein TNCV_2627111 [Trichonephila clavipes]|uniref:Uncharacterized protein n=1 Tax=Trichonephila clavipes TaxID=2585209 RepID=A0A8X6W836_TRICX|nr:hypothetical protein TNCV_2627111 [Trichonephila clavipes]
MKYIKDMQVSDHGKPGLKIKRTVILDELACRYFLSQQLRSLKRRVSSGLGNVLLVSDPLLAYLHQHR